MRKISFCFSILQWMFFQVFVKHFAVLFYLKINHFIVLNEPVSPWGAKYLKYLASLLFWHFCPSFSVSDHFKCIHQSKSHIVADYKRKQPKITSIHKGPVNWKQLHSLLEQRCALIQNRCPVLKFVNECWGHFRVDFCFYFKRSSRARRFLILWKWVPFAWKPQWFRT